MGTYTIYTQGGGVITFRTGEDDYFNVGTGVLEADLQSQGGLDSPLVSRAIKNIDDIQDGEGTLISTLQATNFNKSVLELDKNNLLEAQNHYFKNQQKILKSSAVSAVRNTQQVINSQDANTSMLFELKKSIEETSSNNLLIQAQILEALQDLTLATQNQKLEATFGDVSLNMDTSVLNENTAKTSLAVEKIAFANEKIALGYDNQILINSKKLEKLEQEIAKDVYYDGEYYTKTQIEKLKGLENLKGAKDENDFSLNDAFEVVEDFLTDGFDLSFNPLESLLKSLKDDLKNDFNENNIKYNLGLGVLK